MRRSSNRLVVLCAGLLLVSCGGTPPTSPEVPQPPQPRPSPPVPQAPAALWGRLTTAVSSITETHAACFPGMLGHTEDHQLYISVSGTTINMLASNNGFQILPEEFSGEIIDRDFSVRTSPNAAAGWDKMRCPDGTLLTAVSVEVAGRFTEDGRAMTATMRERWRQSPDSPDVMLSWQWTAARQSQ